MSTLLASRTRVAAPSVNLLPPEIAEGEKLRRFQALLAVIVVVALLLTAAMYFSVRSGRSTAEAELLATQATQAQLQAEHASYSHVPAAKARLESIEAMFATAMGREVRWSTYLRDLQSTVPKNVWLTDMTVSMTEEGAASGEPGALPGLGTITFIGKAKKHEDVADWLRSLDKQTGYSDATYDYSRVKAADGQMPALVEFTSRVTINEKALSGRYENGSGQ